MHSCPEVSTRPLHGKEAYKRVCVTRWTRCRVVRGSRHGPISSQMEQEMDIVKRALPLAFIIGTLLLILGCRSGTNDGGAVNSADGARAQSGPVTLRLGYFPNMTHTQPIVGLARGTFAENLGPSVKIETTT